MKKNSGYIFREMLLNVGKWATDWNLMSLVCYLYHLCTQMYYQLLFYLQVGNMFLSCKQAEGI